MIVKDYINEHVIVNDNMYPKGDDSRIVAIYLLNGRLYSGTTLDLAAYLDNDAHETKDDLIELGKNKASK